MYVTYICTHVPDLLLHMCTCQILLYSVPVVPATSAYICHSCCICDSCCLGCGKGALLCAIKVPPLPSLWSEVFPDLQGTWLIAHTQTEVLPSSGGHGLGVWQLCVFQGSWSGWLQPLMEHEKTKETEL